ncbi:tetratricopeptide repeat protein [Longimonas halophila]|uniref:tetratricopeptide repeat protein n=1 Tax=Longimonas halophila TaxID=1469170 RepID=UPI0015969D10|nr:tetratricopeptide repeat protein [Longimonas halophila]
MALTSSAPRTFWRTSVALAAIVMLMLGPALLDAAAQRPPRPPSPERMPDASDATGPTSASDSLQQAQQYIQQGTYERGIALLEQLVNDYPERLTFQYELIDAYEATKAYDEALALLNANLDSPSVSDLVTKGRLQHLAGREDAARQTWDDAIALYPERASTYRSLYHTLTTLRQFNTAIDVVQQGREALGEPDAFQTELAHLYSLDGQYAASMREYVALLETDERRLRFVQSRLQPFLDQSGGLGDAATVLEEAVEANPDHTAYLDLLAWLYAEQSDYDAALDAYTRLDTLRNDEGQTVLDLARQAAEANAPEAARNALHAVRTQFTDTQAAQLADKIAGDMAYRRWKQAKPFTTDATEAANQAWSTYRGAIESASSAADGPPEAYASLWMRLAELALEVRDDPEAARQAHAALAQFSGHAAQRTLLAGRIALHTNDLSGARAHLDSLAQASAQTPAQHMLALLDLHDGATDQAQERLDALLSDFSHDAANDAVTLHAAIRHFQCSDSTSTPLTHYARGLLRERQHRWAAADSAYATLINEMPRTPLATRARYQRAHLAAHLQGPAEAATALQRFATQFPRHPWADRALFTSAELLDYAQRETAAAREVYMQLLEEHPRSVFASQARTRVRALPAS